MVRTRVRGHIRKDGTRVKPHVRKTNPLEELQSRYPEVTVDMKVVQAFDNAPPYLKIVRRVIRDADGKPYLLRRENGRAYINSMPLEWGQVSVPEEAIRRSRR